MQIILQSLFHQREPETIVYTSAAAYGMQPEVHSHLHSCTNIQGGSHHCSSWRRTVTMTTVVWHKTAVYSVLCVCVWAQWGGPCSSVCNLISWRLSFLGLRLLVIHLLLLFHSTCREPHLILLYLSFSNLSWTAHIPPTRFISSPAAPSPSHPLLCHPSLYVVWKLPVSFICTFHGRAVLFKFRNLFIISGLCFWCLIKRLRYANSQLIPLISVCLGNLGAKPSKCAA